MDGVSIPHFEQKFLQMQNEAAKPFNPPQEHKVEKSKKNQKNQISDETVTAP
jgi:hypothetical protein